MPAEAMESNRWERDLLLDRWRQWDTHIGGRNSDWGSECNGRQWELEGNSVSRNVSSALKTVSSRKWYEQ